MGEEQRYDWQNKAFRHKQREEWHEAIECYKNAIECREKFEGEVEELFIIDIYENNLHDYKMAEVWSMTLQKPFRAELDVDMLLRRGLWRKAFLQAERDMKENLDSMHHFFVDTYDLYDKHRHDDLEENMTASNWYEAFINCCSISFLNTTNDLMKVFGKALVEIGGIDEVDEYEDELGDIKHTIDDILQKIDVLTMKTKCSNSVCIWPPMPIDYPNDEAHWHKELEEKASLVKQLPIKTNAE